MTPNEYIAKQDISRKQILGDIHRIILEEDPKIEAEVGLMMGKEMILYKDRKCFKYGLASVKNHMSLHLMPIYMNTTLHAKYLSLLPHAEFQKGCINFKTPGDVPSPVIRQLLADCSKISIADMLEKRDSLRKAK